MADTEFSALPPTSSIAATDQILLVRGGVAYRFTGTLPTLDGSGLTVGTGTVNTTVGGGIGDLLPLFAGRLAAGAVIARISHRVEATAPYAGGITFEVYRANYGLVEGARLTGEGVFSVPQLIVAANRSANGVVAPTPGQLPAAASLFVTNAAQAYGLLFGVTGTSGSTWIQSQRVDGTATTYDLLVQPAGGNMLVGTTSGTCHRIAKGVAEGSAVLAVAGATDCVTLFAVAGTGASGAATAASFQKHSATGRSVNAAGTINVNGADYSEYMVKAADCAPIAAGDVCGVTHAGELTRSWADAHSYAVKSTEPSIVGGDTWAAHLPARPEAPPALPAEPQPPKPLAPPPPLPPAPDSDDPAALAAHAEAIAARAEAVAAAEAAHAEAVAAYPAAHAEWVSARDAHAIATADYEAAVAAWDAQLEAARQRVDRIAFCGQVPVNVSAEVLAACEAALAAGQPAYIVAVQDLDGIGVMLVRASEMTLDSYMHRLGKLWAVRDGRPVIDVQHG